MTYDLSSLSSRLRSARNAKGLSQMSTSLIAEVGITTVSDIERKVIAFPRISIIAKLAEALDVSPGWLAFGE